MLNFQYQQLQKAQNSTIKFEQGHKSENEEMKPVNNKSLDNASNRYKIKKFWEVTTKDYYEK